MHTTPTVPTSKTLVILGEAPGEEEEKTNTPFVGPSGNLLRQQLMPKAGLDISEWHITNVFQTRPPNNDLKAWTANKTELKSLGLTPTGSPIQKRYLLPRFQPQLSTTEKLIQTLRPNLIVALGATAQWFLLSDDRIGTFRGSFFQTRFGCPAISTFHPAAALREYKMVPVITMDLIKARQFLDGSLPDPIRRELWYDPTFPDIMKVYARFRMRSSEPFGVDIETCPSIDQITTISFSFPDLGICIPFWDKNAPAGSDPSYWPEPSDEVKAWRWVEKFCRLPNPKVLQNGLYDLQYLLDGPVQVRLAGPTEDTSIMQHAFQPELRKDLGSLASFYLNEPSWKQMRQSSKDSKADD